jgi:alkylation response protein AidB-like acyl-CoA dehydrogenase
MDYDLNKEQNLIKKTAREFLSKECDSLFVRDMEKDEKGFTPKLWNKLSELGWLGLMFPDEYGGLSGSYLDLTVLLMEMGYHCMPGPFFSTVVLGGMTLMEAGNTEQKKDLLTKISDGKLFMTLALTEISAGYTPDKIHVKAEKNKDGFVINGTKLFVPDAHVADKIICVARTAERDNKKDGITLFIVDKQSKGLEITPLDTFAGDKLSEVNFNNVCVKEKDILGEQNKGWDVVAKVIQLAAVGKCAEMIGGGERSMEIAIENSKGREQFGQKIGSFQAVQHHCANILTHLDTSRMMTYEAAWKISDGLSFEKDVAMTKAWVSDSCRQLVALSHQVMGGLGFMEEYDLQLFFRKTKAAGVYYGNADFYRDVLAEKLGM